MYDKTYTAFLESSFLIVFIVTLRLRLHCLPPVLKQILRLGIIEILVAAWLFVPWYQAYSVTCTISSTVLRSMEYFDKSNRDVKTHGQSEALLVSSLHLIPIYSVFESETHWQRWKRRNPSYSSLFPVLFYSLFLCLNRHLTHNLDQTFKVCDMSCVSHVSASIAFLAGVKQEAEYKYEYGPFAGMFPSLHTSVDSFLHGVNGDAVIRWEDMHSKLASCRRGGAPRRVCQP